MKVSKLIELLQQRDPDAIVCLDVEVTGEPIPDPVGGIGSETVRSSNIHGIIVYDYNLGDEETSVLVLQGNRAWAKADAKSRAARQAQRAADAKQATAEMAEELEPCLEPQCKRCGGTGVIETGNNDLPCDCPAGDTAKFNVAGHGLVTGAELRGRP